MSLAHPLADGDQIQKRKARKGEGIGRLAGGGHLRLVVGLDGVGLPEVVVLWPDGGTTNVPTMRVGGTVATMKGAAVKRIGGGMRRDPLFVNTSIVVTTTTKTAKHVGVGMMTEIHRGAHHDRLRFVGTS